MIDDVGFAADINSFFTVTVRQILNDVLLVDKLYYQKRNRAKFTIYFIKKLLLLKKVNQLKNVVALNQKLNNV